MAPWERGKGVTKRMQRFCLQLVKRRYLGVKVAQLAREEPLPLWGLKKYHLITKQGVLLVRFNVSTLLAGLGLSVTCCQAGPSYRAGSPTTESSLRLLAAKGLEWRKDRRKRQRVITLCTRPVLILHGGEGSWCCLGVDAFGCDCAQMQSQFPWHLQLRTLRLTGLNVLCLLLRAPQL